MWLKKNIKCDIWSSSLEFFLEKRQTINQLSQIVSEQFCVTWQGGLLLQLLSEEIVYVVLRVITMLMVGPAHLQQDEQQITEMSNFRFLEKYKTNILFDQSLRKLIFKKGHLPKTLTPCISITHTISSIIYYIYYT